MIFSNMCREFPFLQQKMTLQTLYTVKACNWNCNSLLGIAVKEGIDRTQKSPASRQKKYS